MAVDYDEAKVVINAPPVARAGHDILAAPGEAVTFDAAGSFDPDGQIATYRWDFSDQPEPSLRATRWSGPMPRPACIPRSSP